VKKIKEIFSKIREKHRPKKLPKMAFFSEKLNHLIIAKSKIKKRKKRINEL